ncbi:putative serine/threonine-protein kinase WNK5 [Artemisia annua]|uniref:Putative serine/threonine-protein kinase WNK5 n=1 Tax=Artemisia annua TaxID=35608 RepID=A0A2U1KY27_ARTAN|nr:putative serine/threonine-protein kinase WNK5 [Artemisia annua]
MKKIFSSISKLDQQRDNQVLIFQAIGVFARETAITYPPPGWLPKRANNMGRWGVAFRGCGQQEITSKFKCFSVETLAKEEGTLLTIACYLPTPPIHLARSLDLYQLLSMNPLSRPKMQASCQDRIQLLYPNTPQNPKLPLLTRLINQYDSHAIVDCRPDHVDPQLDMILLSAISQLTKNIYFPFDIQNDTAHDVSAEMVKELDIIHRKPIDSADMIEGDC